MFIYFIFILVTSTVCLVVYKRNIRILYFSVLLIYNVTLIYLIFDGSLLDGFQKLTITVLNKHDLALLGLKINTLILFSFILDKIIVFKLQKAFFTSHFILYSTFILGSISLYIYSRELGGWNVLFSTVLSYRAGVEVVYTRLAFLKTLSVLSSGLYPFLIDRYRITKRRKFFYLSIFAFLIGFGSIFIQGGRLMLLIYLVPLLYALYLANKSIILFIIFVIPLLISPNREIFGKGLGEKNDNQNNVITILFSELVPPISNFNAVISESYSFTYFSHVLTVYKAVIPKRLLGIGDYEGEQVMMKRIVGFPNAVDGLSFGFLSLGYFGSVFWLFLYLKMCRLIDSRLMEINSKGFLITEVYILAYFVIRPMYFSPIHFTLSILPILPLLLTKLNKGRESLFSNKYT